MPSIRASRLPPAPPAPNILGGERFDPRRVVCPFCEFMERWAMIRECIDSMFSSGNLPKVETAITILY